ncbi:replication protein A 70 kDa DNA-binding subunit B [Tanacetum coccineum]
MKLTIRIVLISCFRIRKTTGYKSTSKKTLCSDSNLYSNKGTTVTRIDPIDDNVHGFILEPFNRLLDKGRVYHDYEAVDVIGSVVAIRYVVPVQSSARRKIHRSVVIEDADFQPFSDEYAQNIVFILQLEMSWSMWDEYAQKRNELGHVVFILQLEKVKYWNGAPSIHNALFGTKIVKELPEYEESQFTIEVFTPGKPVVTIAENLTALSMQRSIRSTRRVAGRTPLASIVTKKMNVVETKATTSSSKSKVTFYCEDDGAVQAKSSFKVIMRIIDESGSAPIVFFNSVFNKISGHTAWELMEKHGMDVDEYWPQELDELVGKRFMFKLCIESEDEEESGSSKTPKLITVKLEKID